MRKTPVEEVVDGNTKPLGKSYGPFDKPTCVICGCTSEVPCFDGAQACYWVTMNSETNAGTCSECLGF